MQAKKILLPVDFSTAGDAALKMATVLARDTGATLVILHVEEPPLAYGGGEMYYGIVEPDRTELERMLRDVKPSDPAVKVVYRLVSGDPSHAVCQAAEEEGADFIVVGTHGRTGLGRLLMGSVAESIVRHAKCPVVTVKAPHAPEKRG
jgi:nucleotide-binding universal stress UspA family protein